jgi:hypothetical protein
LEKSHGAFAIELATLQRQWNVDSCFAALLARQLDSSKQLYLAYYTNINSIAKESGGFFSSIFV